MQKNMKHCTCLLYTSASEAFRKFEREQEYKREQRKKREEEQRFLQEFEGELEQEDVDDFLRQFELELAEEEENEANESVNCLLYTSRCV